MKNTLISLAVFVLLCTFSCERFEVENLPDEHKVLVQTNAKNGDNSFDPNTDVVAELVEEELQLVITPATLERAVKKANPKIQQLKSYAFQVDADGGEEYGNEEVTFLLVEVDLKEGSHQLIAFDLQKDKVFYRLNMVSAGNSCTGHCCNKCQWSRRAGMPYHTCWCVSPDTRDGCGPTSSGCDHTLTMPKSDLIKEVK